MGRDFSAHFSSEYTNLNNTKTAYLTQNVAFSSRITEKLSRFLIFKYLKTWRIVIYSWDPRLNVYDKKQFFDSQELSEMANSFMVLPLKCPTLSTGWSMGV